MVERFEELRRICPRHSAAWICRALPLPYGTLRRWRARLRRGVPVRRKPGPAKSSALPVSAFRLRVARLIRGSLRSGFGALHADFRTSVSRRRLRAMVARLRGIRRRRWRAATQHVTWSAPNLAWAIDAMHLHTAAGGPGAVVVLARDLASHYHFEPLVLRAESADANLRWLRGLFSRHGPPLFLKRDNGSPFNTPAIDTYLASVGVITLNSPARHPSYNGAIEHGVGSCKRALLAALDPSRPVPAMPSLLALLHSLIHLHNARPRRSLRGESPAQARFRGPPGKWSRARRHEIFDWISAKFADILQSKRENHDRRSPAAAWRAAEVVWLRCQRLITVSRKPTL